MWQPLTGFTDYNETVFSLGNYCVFSYKSSLYNHTRVKLIFLSLGGHLCLIFENGCCCWYTLIKRHLDHKFMNCALQHTNNAAIIKNNILHTFYMEELKMTELKAVLFIQVWVCGKMKREIMGQIITKSHTQESGRRFDWRKGRTTNSQCKFWANARLWKQVLNGRTQQRILGNTRVKGQLIMQNTSEVIGLCPQWHRADNDPFLCTFNLI